MRVLQLLGVAAQAEALRLKREAGGMARSAGWTAAAALLGLLAILLLHLAAVAWLVPGRGLAGAAALVAVADLALAGLLLLVARRRRDPVAAEALALRRDSLAAIGGRGPLRDPVGLSLPAGAAPLLGAFAAEAAMSWLRRRR